MIERKPIFAWGSGKRGKAFHVVWFLAVAYLCGVLTVPLMTLSSRIVKPVVRNDEESAVEPEVVEVQRVVQVQPTSRRTHSQGTLLKTQPEAPDFYTFKSSCPDTAATLPGEVRATVLANIFDGVSPFEGFPPEFAVPYLRKSQVRGWGSRAAVFEQLVNEVRPGVVIELGAFLGASAIHLANLTRNLGLETTILCLDDFRGWPGFRSSHRLAQVNANVMLLYQFMQNVQTEGFQDVILPVPFSTGGSLTKMCDWGIKADLIEVDAGHDFHSAWTDINGAYQLLKPGGVMFGHDYFNSFDRRGVGRAVNMFAKKHGFTVEPNGAHWILRGTP